MKARDLFPYWADARDLLVQAVERLDDDHLDWRPPEAPRSIRDILCHVVDFQRRWLQLLRGGECVPPSTADAPARSLAMPDILSELERSQAGTERLLDELDVDDLSTKRVRFGTGAEFTYRWVLTHLHEHEIHHRGQIFLLLWMQGLEPPEL